MGRQRCGWTGAENGFKPNVLGHRLGIAVWLLLSLAGCAQCGLGPEDPETEEPARLSEGGVAAMGAEHTPVTFFLDWDFGDAPVRTDSGSFLLHNDLGYRIRVDQALLTAYSLELVLCDAEPVAPARGSGEGKGAWLPSLFSVAVAYAGHSVGEVRPSRLLAPRIEVPHMHRSSEMGRLRVPHGEYCRVHYLIARSPERAVGLVAIPSMRGKSLYLRGSYRPSDAADEKPFELSTAAANGVLAILRPAKDNGAGEGGSAAGALGVRLKLDSSVDSLEVRVKRDFTAMFDGIDFETMSDKTAFRRILTNMIDGTTVSFVETASESRDVQ